MSDNRINELDEKGQKILREFFSGPSSPRYRTVGGVSRATGLEDKEVRDFIRDHPELFDTSPLSPATGSVFYMPSGSAVEAMGEEGPQRTYNGSPEKRPRFAPYPEKAAFLLMKALHVTRLACAESPYQEETPGEAEELLDRFRNVQANFDTTAFPPSLSPVILRAIGELRSGDPEKALGTLEEAQRVLEEYWSS